jgi:hypothetical protein
VTFASTLNGAQNLTITAGIGNVTFTGAVGGTTRLELLNIVSAGNVGATALTLGAFDSEGNLASAIGAVIFASTLDSTTSGVVTFTQSGTTVIASASDTEDLTITPGTGLVTFTGTASGITSLGTLSIVRPVTVVSSNVNQVLVSQTISQFQVFGDIGGPRNNRELDKFFSLDATTAPFILTGGFATNSVFESSPEIFGGSNNTNDSQENTDERSKR